MRILLGIVAAILVISGLLLVGFGALTIYIDEREGFPTCSDAASPRGAEPFEAAFNSYRIEPFALGLYCVWNMKDGTTSETFHDSWRPTAVTYPGILSFAGGIALLNRKRIGRIARSARQRG